MGRKEEAQEISGKTQNASPWRLCVAPMMDWTEIA